MATVPDALKGFWGAIVSAASQRLNVAGAFDAVRNAAENAGVEVPAGIDAVTMGQAYSAAVRNRNAAESLGASVANIQSAEGNLADMYRNNPVTSDMITPITPWTSALQSDVMPSYVIQFGVEVSTPEGTSQEFRRISLGNEIPQTIGQVMDLVDNLNSVMAEEYGVTQTVTSYGNIFTL